jgi:hypothetical protein
MNSLARKDCLLLILRRCGFLIVVSLLLLESGCKKAEGPPPALTLEQLPAALEKAFAKPQPEASESLTTLLMALREKDYPKAFTALQAVSAAPGLNKDQANVAASGLMTLNSALQDAQGQGDQNAAQTLQTYRATK